MKIKILGAGETGKFLSKHLSLKRNKITLIDESRPLLSELNEVMEIATVCGNGAESTVLNEARVDEADLFVALTNNQHVNLIAGSLAKKMGAKKSISRVHVPLQQCQDHFNYRDHFKLDYIFSSEQLTAAEIGKYFVSPEATGIEQIGRGKIKLQLVTISEQCKLLDQPILSLSLPPRVRIAVIHRDSEDIIPKGHHSLEAGDQVTLFGEQNQVDELAKILMADKRLYETKRITIYGGNDYGYCLADQLRDKQFRVRVIDKDPDVCIRLSEKLPHAVVVNGDGRSQNFLREEQVDGTDFYIGATFDDEENIMACLQADSIRVKHVIPIIHDADNSRILARNLKQFHFLTTVSPRLVNLADIVRFVESNELHHVGFLSGDVELVQFTVREDAKVVGKQVSEVSWPEKCSLVTFLRNEEAIVPDGHDEIRAGDSLYAVILPEAGKPLRNLLAG